MKASEARLLDFLKKSSQFVIPIYQRIYSWTERECRQLWDDIVRCGSSDKIAVHFVGSIVYVESGVSQVTHQSPLLVIFILMGLEPALQTRLYEQFWRPMELDFGQEAYGTHFDGFMRHYLTVKTGEIPNINAVYDAFKEHARASRADAASDQSHVEDLVRDIRDYARHFCAMALGSEPDAELKAAFHDLRELKVDVAYPFLLELYHDYKRSLDLQLGNGDNA